MGTSGCAHVAVGIDAVQAAGDDQALQDADVLGAEFGPTEHPRFSIIQTFG